MGRVRFWSVAWLVRMGALFFEAPGKLFDSLWVSSSVGIFVDIPAGFKF